MTISIERFQMSTIILIITGMISLSFPVQMGMANEVDNKSKRVLPTKEVLEKRAWVKKQTPVKPSKLILEQKVLATILSVMTDYRTGLSDQEKDQISYLILKQSKKYRYDPLFITALIITESSFNHRAKSKVGALGLMQIRPRTGKALASETNIQWRGKRTLYHPEDNIALGTFYLDKLVKRFGNVKTALEAYNHGPTRTARYLRRGKKTKKYSGKVFAIYHQIRLAKANS
jgi:soluble lytic murein transglycosylase-like protein